MKKYNELTTKEKIAYLRKEAYRLQYKNEDFAKKERDRKRKKYNSDPEYRRKKLEKAKEKRNEEKKYTRG